MESPKSKNARARPRAAAPSQGSLVQRLHALRRAFDPASSAQKLALVRELIACRRLSGRDLLLLHDTLEFLRAYPDDARLLEELRRLRPRLREWIELLPEGTATAALRDTGFPGSSNTHNYSFAVTRHLLARRPGLLEIDWEAFEDESVLGNVAEVVMHASECEGVDDLRVGWSEWLDHARAGSGASDLEVLLALFERAPVEGGGAFLFEVCNVPVRYRLAEVGTARCECELAVERVCYQSRELESERFPLQPMIEAPLRAPLRRMPLARGRDLVDLAIAALASRKLEIYPLIYADPGDVVLYAAERGFQILWIGMQPEHRSALAAISFFLVLKNGVPIAYGPASPFLGCCEMGINLFPEFRGGEIRYVYSQVMHLLHHAYDVDYFYLTSYGMGDGNEEAIESGAFWFYRKLGFRPTNPVVEALAQAEEARMRAEPGYRSGVRTLRRLADTEAYLDLSGGACRRFAFGRIGMQSTRYVQQRYGGDRGMAERRASARVERALGLRSSARWSKAERRALANMAPILAQIPDLERWSTREKQGLVRILRAKGAPSEAAAMSLMRRHARFAAALHALTE